MVKLLVILSLVLIPIVLLLWLGLRVKPKPFTPYPENTPQLEMAELPVDLPPPVARYYGNIMGENVPVIESAVVSGRGTARLSGLTIPTRWRFTYNAGQGYRHYMESTLFGLPIMKVNETYLDGRARLALPFGVVENEPKIDMAANLGLWAESIWLPSIYLTDTRVRWEAVDDHSARLIVPFGDTEDAFTVTFDPQTGLLRTLETMRYREAADGEKILWRNEVLEWGRFHGVLIPDVATVTWMDEGTPWLNLTVEEVVYNVDVSAYIRGSGP
jgi:hypothetical protein